MKVPVSKILFGERKRVDYGDLAALAESIKRVGQIQPIVVRKIEGNERYDYELVAGGRRYKAHILAGLAEIDVRVREECDELMLRELELEENLRRKNLTWAEECSMQLELDELRRKQVEGNLLATEKWGMRDTALALDQSLGKTCTNLELAKAMKDDPKLALELIRYPKGVAYKKLKQIKEKEKHERMFSSGKLKTNVALKLGSCTDLIKEVKDNSVQLVITDPPYAVTTIDEAKGSYNDLQEDNDNSNEETMTDVYEKLFPELFRVLQPGSHMYIFHASEWYQTLVDLLKQAGFIVDPVPLIWYKMRTTTPFRGYSYQQTYEPILFAQKPPREKRQIIAPSGNVLSFKMIDQASKRHSYHKPPELIDFLINQSSHKGELVLDPFAGSGQTLKSAVAANRNALGFELSERHYYKALEYLNGKEDENKPALSDVSA
jgi:site-specific DNA-methyltransferase (adenine-specific)